jgi:hypothetical protein
MSFAFDEIKAHAMSTESDDIRLHLGSMGLYKASSWAISTGSRSSAGSNPKTRE